MLHGRLDIGGEANFSIIPAILLHAYGQQTTNSVCSYLAWTSRYWKGSQFFHHSSNDFAMQDLHAYMDVATFKTLLLTPSKLKLLDYLFQNQSLKFLEKSTFEPFSFTIPSEIYAEVIYSLYRVHLKSHRLMRIAFYFMKI